MDGRPHAYISNKDHNTKAGQYETSFLMGWHFHTGPEEQLSPRASCFKHKSLLVILPHSSISMGTNPTNAFLKTVYKREMEGRYFFVFPWLVCTKVLKIRQKIITGGSFPETSLGINKFIKTETEIQFSFLLQIQLTTSSVYNQYFSIKNGTLKKVNPPAELFQLQHHSLLQEKNRKV